MPSPSGGSAPHPRARDVLRWLRPPVDPSAEGPFTELDARRLGPVRRFFVRHRVVMDVVVAVLFVLPAMLEPLARAVEGSQDPRMSLSGWSILLILLGGLVLMRRRREPVLVLIALLLLLVVSFVLTGFTGGFEVALAFAVYAVAAHRRLWIAWVALIVVLGVLSICAAVFLTGEQVDASGIGRGFVVTFIVFYQAFLALTALVMGVSVRARRQHIDELIVRANTMAHDREQRAALAVAEERTRIARELHDVVAHSLTVMVALADGARASAATDTDGSARALEALTEIGRSSLADMRRVLGVLRDPGDDAPLEPEPDVGLDELVERFRAAGLPVRVLRAGVHDDLDTAVRRAVWRIVQESLTNVLRYAPASTRVLVSLVRRDERASAGGDWFDVRIANHLAPDATAPPTTPGTGRGIIGMRERAAAHAGTVEAGPTPDGWQVAASLRLDRTPQEHP